MDPEEALKELRQLTDKILVSIGTVSRKEVMRVAELFEAIDEWLCTGGFIPTEWKN